MKVPAIRCCPACRAPLVPKRWPCGKPEAPAQFARRSFCDRTCQLFRRRTKQRPSHPWIQAGTAAKRRQVRAIAERIAAMRAAARRRAEPEAA